MKDMDKLPMRQAVAEALVELSERCEEIFVLDADVSKSTRSVQFQEAHPDCFLNLGIAEANMVSIAAGLATCGLTPVVNSFSMLLSLRALDQIRQSIAYPRLNVKIMAHYGGLSSGPEGPTHQACEDIGIVRSIPNLTVLVPCDATEAKQALRAAVDFDGPIYMRLCRNPVPRVHDEPHPFRIGEGYELLPGGDVTVVATGVMVARALDAAQMLSGEGVSCRVVAMPTIKPLDYALVERCARETGAVVTAEEHNVFGGLGSAVAEALVESLPVPMERVGIRDQFAESGEYFALMDKYGLAVTDVVAAVRRVLERKASLSGRSGV
jgi:transketolase